MTLRLSLWQIILIVLILLGLLLGNALKAIENATAGAWVLLLTLLLAIAFPFARRRWELFAPISVFAAIHLGFALGGWYALVNNFRVPRASALGTAAASGMIHTVSLIILGMFAFYITYLLIAGDIRSEQFVPQQLNLELRPDVVFILIVLTLAGTAWYYFDFIRPLGGFGNVMFIATGNSLVAQQAAELGASSLGARLVVAAHLLWSLYFLNAQRGRWIGVALFASHFLLTTFVQILTARLTSSVLMMWGTLAIRYRFSVRGYRVPRRIYIGVALVMVILALSLYGVRHGLRLAAVSNDTEEIYASLTYLFSAEGFAERIIEGGNMPDLYMPMRIMDAYPNRFPFLYGETLTYGPLLYIGRFVNPEGRDSDYAFAVTLRERWDRGRDAGADPVTLYGELYANFGAVGILGGMTAFGWLYAQLYQLLFRINDPRFTLVYALCTMLLLILLRTETSVYFKSILDWTITAAVGWVLLWGFRTLYHTIAGRPLTFPRREVQP